MNFTETNDHTFKENYRVGGIYYAPTLDKKNYVGKQIAKTVNAGVHLSYKT